MSSVAEPPESFPTVLHLNSRYNEEFLMITLRRSEERGGGNHGWLNTKHSFLLGLLRPEAHGIPVPAGHQ